MEGDESTGSTDSTKNRPNATIQPGTQIDKHLWQRFKDDVRSRRGRINGVLGNELERALEAYLEGSHGGDVTDELRRLREDMEEIRGVVVEGEAPALSDGGAEKNKNSPGKDSRIEKPVDRHEREDDRSIVERRTDAALADLLSVHPDQFKLDDLDAAIESGAGVTSRQSVKKYRERVFDRLGGMKNLEHPATKKKPLQSKIFFTDEAEAKLATGFHLVKQYDVPLDEAVDRSGADVDDLVDRIDVDPDLVLEDVETGELDLGDELVSVDDAAAVGPADD